jgi:hypothetical protein
MNMNLNVDYSSPLMLVALSVGVMVLLNFLLPMIPMNLPLVSNAVEFSGMAKDNLVGAAVYVVLVTYVASVAKDMLRL